MSDVTEMYLARSPGTVVFNIVRKNSGRADTSVRFGEKTTLRIRSETGAKGGGGAGSGTWAKHALYINGKELAGAANGSNFNDWNGICEAVHTFEADTLYSIVANQDNGGCTVINTDLRGTIV
ncbi:hypothetical protein [Ideonella sp. BN130291]|uniref:hypothetical protein n=1 Tax=Ideonella sp. BN130291 TaxID=3112940 RepID=UPI002E26B014|nr:hypothetical protein [Ideonella sp. BN130291]